MKKLVLLIILFTTKSTFGQTQMAPFELSQSKKLSVDAYTVFKTNKFLDFKERDTLVEVINGTIYKKTDLNNYFGYKKNWDEIEKETSATYKKEDEKYGYTWVDSTMVETYKKFGAYEVWREIKTVYNSKGFVLSRHEKVFVGDNYKEAQIIINEFDDRNRVIKIINRTERKNQEENKESIIQAVYEANSVKVTSENGMILCKFITDNNSIGFISKLSPRETASSFMYALRNKQLDVAKDYCTHKMIEKIEVHPILDNQIEEVSFISGSDKFSQESVTMSDVWEIRSSTSRKVKYKVEFVMTKQQNGWKIDEFRINN